MFIFCLVLSCSVYLFPVNKTFAASNIGTPSDQEVFKTFMVNDLNQDRFDSAEKRATAYVARFRKDPEGWEALGLVKLLRADYRQAEECFSNALLLSKSVGFSSADYLLFHAYALIAMGRVRSGVRKLREASYETETKDKAKFLIGYVQKNRLPNPIELYRISDLDSGEKFIESVDKQVDQLDASTGLESGYNSNVLFFSDNLIDSISRSNTESYYLRPFGSVSYKNENTDRFYKLALQFKSSSYFTEQARRFNDFSPSIDLELKQKTSSTFHWGLRSFSILNFLNISGFGYYSGAQNFSLFADSFWTPTFKSRSTIFVQPQNYSPETYSSSQDNRSGLSYGASFTNFLAFRDQIFSLGFAFSESDTEGINYKTRSYSAPFSISWKAVESWTGRISGQYMLTNFLESTLSRRDHSLSANFSTYVRIMNQFYIGAKYSYINNRSNRDTYDFQRHEAGGLVLYEIF